MLNLVFNSYLDAYIANAIISLNMRLSGNITAEWGLIRERVDGKYVLPCPDQQYMTYVSGYIDIQEYQDDWFPSEEE